MTYPTVMTLSFDAIERAGAAIALRFVMIGTKPFVLADDIYEQFSLDPERQPQYLRHLDALEIETGANRVCEGASTLGPFALLSEEAVFELSGFCQASSGVFDDWDIADVFYEATAVHAGWSKIGELTALMGEGEMEELSFRRAISHVACAMLHNCELSDNPCLIGRNGLPQISRTEHQALSSLKLTDAEIALINAVADLSHGAWQRAAGILELRNTE